MSKFGQQHEEEVLGISWGARADRSGTIREVHCRTCTHSLRLTFSSTAAAVAGHVAKSFRERGWQLGRFVLCPACHDTNKAAPSRPLVRLITPSSPPPKQEKTVDIKLDIRNVVRIEGKLSEHFHEGRYVEGWSDERVARETGLAVEFVRNVRLETGRALTLPTEVSGLVNELAVLTEMLKEFGVRVHKIATQFK